MKAATLKILVSTIVFAAALPVFAEQPAKADLQKQLKAIRTAELPGHVAGLVAASPIADREAITASIVTTAVEVNPSAAPAIVGAIARSTPSLAATAARSAVAAQPKLAAQITKAAVGAAPSEAKAIVAAVCKERPTAFYSVGVAAASVAPKSGSDILDAVASATPALKTLVVQARSDYSSSKRISVSAVLKRADSLLQALARSSKSSPDTILAGETTPELTTKLASLAQTLAAPPVVGPPFTPGGPSPGEIDTTETFEAPPTGRDYSAP